MEGVGEAVVGMAEVLHTGALELEHMEALELELELDLEVDNKRVLTEALAQPELMGLSFEIS